MKRYNFMGSPVDLYSWRELLIEIEKRIKEKNITNLIQFLNVAKVVKAKNDIYLNKILWDADFVLADGRPLLFFGKRIGIDIPDQIAGIDLMQNLIELSNRKKYSIFLLGAKPEVLNLCVNNITKKYKDIKIAGYRHGYFEKMHVPEIIQEINSSHPDILFIGMPTPMKEYFAYENRTLLRVPIIQGVGGSFDVLAGKVNRAPKFMQNYGLEWFYRVIQEPRRLFWRYFFTNSLFLYMFIGALSGSYRRYEKTNNPYA